MRDESKLPIVTLELLEYLKKTYSSSKLYDSSSSVDTIRFYQGVFKVITHLDQLHEDQKESTQLNLTM